MSNVAKNIVTILGVLTIAYAGYYLFVQTANETAIESSSLDQMLANTQVFIARSQELDQMNFDLSVFENTRFRTLRTFTEPVLSEPVGKSDPFKEGTNSPTEDSSTE